jgi:thiol-disulfide isomerase/thioredoxin
MAASITFSDSGTQSTAADTALIHVQYNGEDTWCGRCDALSETVSTLKAEVDGLKAINVARDAADELARAETLKLSVALGDLIGYLYVRVFQKAKAMKGFPKQLSDGTEVDMPIFLRLSRKDNVNKFYPFLMKVLEEFKMTEEDFDTLINTKRTRNEMCHHFEITNDELLHIVQETPAEGLFATAREIVIAHEAAFKEPED